MSSVAVEKSFVDLILDREQCWPLLPNVLVPGLDISVGFVLIAR